MEPVQKFSRMPRKLSRRTLRRREREAIGGIHALNQVDPLSVIERYIAGEKMKNMAQQYGVSDVAMYAFLLRHVPEEWYGAQKARAFAHKERGENGLENPRDPLALGAAREQLRAGQWDLERVDRKVYGRDEQVTITLVDLGDRLRRARERVTEGEVVELENSNAASIHSRALEDSAGADPRSPQDRRQF
jgi:hypothetical protein